MDRTLHLIGIARKAGRLETGEEPVGAAARARHARLILLAADAADNSCRRATHFGMVGNVLVLQTPYTKAELGVASGRSSCAMMALTDAGLAASIVNKLAAADPERYGSAAQQLSVRAEQVLKRKKEQRIHEKNLREGKRKPWAAIPVRREQKKEASADVKKKT
ncbi:MAG: 50S ribosomal protein L7 [Intestinimonas sp.]|nr:50S ribosomal protein L7 [Intestinimonas sp.]